MARTRVVAKALIVRGDEVLLLRRSASDYWRPGKLDLAGGTIEPSEDILEGLIREIHEETGLEIHKNHAQLAYTNTSIVDGKSMSRLYFVAQDTSNTEVVMSEEHNRAYWLSLDEAIDQNDHPIQKAFLEHVKANALLA